MRNIGLLIIANMRNDLRSKTATIVNFSITLMLIGILAAFFGIFLIKPELNSNPPDKDKLELYLGLIMYSASILGLGIYLNSLGYQSMIKEKSRGNIQSLLATTLNTKNIWMGKSLAVFIPGLILGELLTLIVLIVINYIYFIPTIGFLFNPWIAVSCFLVVPLMYFCLSLLVYLIGLTGKPANGMLIAQVFLPLILSGMINLLLHTNILDGTSWPFVLANIGIAALVGIIVVFLKFRLSRERIVLSY